MWSFSSHINIGRVKAARALGSRTLTNLTNPTSQMAIVFITPPRLPILAVAYVGSALNTLLSQGVPVTTVFPSLLCHLPTLKMLSEALRQGLPGSDHMVPLQPHSKVVSVPKCPTMTTTGIRFPGQPWALNVAPAILET